MKKKLIIVLLLLFLTSLAPTGAGAASWDPNLRVRIGLSYGSNAAESVNIFYADGFRYGQLGADGNSFYEIYDDNSRFISVGMDANLYYDGSKLSTSGAGTLIGAYHVQIEQLFYDKVTVDALLDELRAAGYVCFAACTDGGLKARVGSFAAGTDATALKEELAGKLEVPVKVVGERETTFTVVDMNSGVILFEFDDASQDGFAVRPKETGGGAPQMKNGSKYYYGDFEFRRNGGRLTFINVLDVETYVKGVVPYEMSPSWPLEALSAQAVCARNYAYNNLGKHKSYGFDLCAGVDCQTYSGSGSMTELTNQAVDRTRGQLLTYNGQVAQLYYHSSSGGSTENSENVWSAAIPYLIAVDTPYEDLDKAINGRWNFELTRQELTDHLNAKNYGLALIADISIKYTPAGNAYSVTVTDVNGKTVTMSKETMRIRLSPYVKSQCFTITKKPVGGGSGNSAVAINNGTTTDPISTLYTIDGNGAIIQAPQSPAVLTANGQETLIQSSGVQPGDDFTIVIDGRGWGNNVGMSQWSARGMAEHGSNYEEILLHFFPGTTLSQLS